MDVRIVELPQPEQDAASNNPSNNQNAKRQEATARPTVRPAPPPSRSAPRRPDVARPAPPKTESPPTLPRSPQTVERTPSPLQSAQSTQLTQPPAPAHPAETADTPPSLNNAAPPVAQQSAPGNSDTPSSAPARLLSQPLPELPDDLREEGYQFVAVARFVIHADGSFDVQLIHPTPNPRLNQILMQTLHKWRFDPATEAGHPVETHQDVRVHFNVD